MKLAVLADREHSLNLMHRAYAHAKSNTSVGRDFYIGQYLDEATNLDYLNARYYDSARGQFLSQDPVFWEDPKKQDLRNPQSLNSYAYANDNPITGSNLTGGQTVNSAVNLVLQAFALILVLYTAILISNPSLSPTMPTGGVGGKSVHLRLLFKRCLPDTQAGCLGPNTSIFRKVRAAKPHRSRVMRIRYETNRSDGLVEGSSAPD